MRLADDFVARGWAKAVGQRAAGVGCLHCASRKFMIGEKVCHGFWTIGAVLKSCTKKAC
jgi:hypothetical protein